MPTPLDPLQQLGTAIPKGYSAKAAMKHAQLLGWNLRKLELRASDYVPGGGRMTFPVPDQFALARTNPKHGAPETLGVVGIQHTAAQNEALIPLLDSLAEQSGACFSTAGEIDGGRRVYVSLELPGYLRIGEDRIQNHLVLLAGRDGQSSTSLNVLSIDPGSGSIIARPGEWKLLNTSPDRAENLLNWCFDRLDQFRTQAGWLQNLALTQSTFEKIITREFGAPTAAPAITQTRFQNKLDKMAALFSDSPDTAWAGLTALAEWHDHFSPVRGTGDALRARKAVLDTRFKDKAWDAMRRGV